MRVYLIVESCTRRFIEAPQFFSYRPYYHRHHHHHIECVTDAHVQAAADQPVEVHRAESQPVQACIPDVDDDDGDWDDGMVVTMEFSAEILRY